MCAFLNFIYKDIIFDDIYFEGVFEGAAPLIWDFFCRNAIR